MKESIRLLLIEDSQNDADLLLRQIERAGFNATYLRVETEAQMKKALHEPWDIIISDHSLPEFGSLPALEIVRKMELEIPFIIVSGSMGEQTAVEAMKAGANDYVMKDNLARLIPVIERELRESQERRKKKETESALTRLREQYTYIAENTLDLIFLLDAEGRFIYASPSFHRVLGYYVEDLLNRSIYELIPETDRERIKKEFKNSSYSAKKKTMMHHLKHSNGREIEVETLANWIFDSDGKPGRQAGVSRDVSLRNRLEAEILQSQKMDSIGRLAGGVAHDFNNMLTAILGISQACLGDLPQNSQLREDIEEIEKTAQRAAKLTRQLLAFSRRQIFEPKMVNLNELIMNLDRMLRRILGEDIEFVFTQEPALGLIKVDPAQMEQVITNLAINARDAMTAGGKLILETSNFIPDEEFIGTCPDLSADKQYVVLMIRDTGSGMTKEVRSKVFEPFFTTKEKGKGTGLGLATCYGIVKQSGGHISLYSEAGKGSIFQIYIPMETGNLESSSKSIVAQTRRGDERILVAEDEPAVRNLISRILKRNGYEVLEAGNGLEAMDLLKEDKKKKIRLILTDVVMPVAGGKKLAEKAAQTRKDLKLLFISGYSENAISEQGVLHPEVQFLAKPFTPEDLLRKVREVLDT